MNDFNFGTFLLENGFSYTNEGSKKPQFYHINKKGTEHWFILRETDFDHTKPAQPKFLRTMTIPKTKRTALKIVKDYVINVG